LTLADYHNQASNVAWPSQKMLGDDCEMPVRTVQWCLAALEKQGFITIVQKGNQYQPTQYRLNMDVAVAQDCEPAISGPASIAPSLVNPQDGAVNPQDGTSEPASSPRSNQQEPTIEPIVLLETYPDWFNTLSQDPRWTGKNPQAYVASVQRKFSDIDLDLEAHSAYEWLQTPKGQKKKILRGFWTNWLKNCNPAPDRAETGDAMDWGQPNIT